MIVRSARLSAAIILVDLPVAWIEREGPSRRPADPRRIATDNVSDNAPRWQKRFSFTCSPKQRWSRRCRFTYTSLVQTHPSYAASMTVSREKSDLQRQPELFRLIPRYARVDHPRYSSGKAKQAVRSCTGHMLTHNYVARPENYSCTQNYLG